MAHAALEQVEVTVAAFPNQVEAAAMLGISQSTLSRDPSIRFEEFGRREKRLSPDEVLRLARVHRRKPINTVAQALIELARTKAPELEDDVSELVDSYFQRNRQDAHSHPGEDFLDEARRALPEKLYAEVERVYRARGGARPAEITGRA